MGLLESRFPGRFAAFLTSGSIHTTLLGNISGFLSPSSTPGGGNANLAVLSSFLGGIETTKTGDALFADWFAAFINGDKAWQPVAP